MTKNELAAKNKEDKRKMLKSNPHNTMADGYLIQTPSDYISLIGPQRFIIEVLSLIITLIILGFYKKIEEILKQNTTMYKILDIITVTLNSDAWFPHKWAK